MKKERIEKSILQTIFPLKYLIREYLSESRLRYTPLMPSLVSITGESWDFARKQQAVLHVGWWFMVLPATVMFALQEFIRRNEVLFNTQPDKALLAMLATMVCVLVLLWGITCILSVGKRLLQAKAGRARTSFKAVRTQASNTFIPYLLTSALQSIFTFLWSLLLIIPGVIYSIRTIFTPVIVVCEGVYYAQALKRSRELVKGHTLEVLWKIIGIAIVTMLPAGFLSQICLILAQDAPLSIVIAGSIAAGIFTSIGLTLYLFSLIQLYDSYRPKGHVRN